MATIKIRRPVWGERSLISVDPGLSGTGVVAWSGPRPVASYVFIPPQSVTRNDVQEGEDDLVARARYLAKMIRDEGSRHNRQLSPHPLTVVIEFPAFQSGAGREMGWKTGSLQKLTFLVGVIVGGLSPAWRTILVEPSGWKGQLPKDVVIRRMTAKFTKPVCDALRVRTHAWDALGIGEWAWRQEFMR